MARVAPFRWRAVGMCGCSSATAGGRRPGLNAYLPAHWGQGYAIEAAAATLATVRASSACDASSASFRREIQLVRVLEKSGMRFERMHSMRAGEPDVRLYGCELGGALNGA